MKFFEILTSDFIVYYDSGPHELRFDGLKLSYRCLCQKLGHNYLGFFMARIRVADFFFSRPTAVSPHPELRLKYFK